MKRISVCLAFTAILLLISVIGLIHIRKCTENMSVYLDSVISCMKDENTIEASKTAMLAKDYWEENTVFSFIYINQGKLLEVSSSISKIIGLIEENSDEVIAECLSLKTYISLVYHTELPIAENIF